MTVPDFISHIQQAHHNLYCARKILADQECRDWAITAAFYAAIHYVEAGLSTFPSADVKDMAGTDTYHNIRQKLVQDKFGKECYVRYRKLREASQNVRYLVNWGVTSKTGTSLGYYSVDDAIKMVEEHVLKIRDVIEQTTGANLHL